VVVGEGVVELDVQLGLGARSASVSTLTMSGRA
jgi:hypothetical protein